VFLQNYRARGIFGINELFFYRKFGGIGPRSTDRVHGGRSTSARTLIRWEPSADRSTAQIKTWEGVSDNLIMVVNTGMDGSRWLPAGAARSRRRAWPAAAAHQSKPLRTLRFTELDKIFTYGIVVTQGSRFAHLGMAADDGGGWRRWGDSAQARRR
jgi:hypothetical protein